jgi:hypothetical protein
MNPKQQQQPYLPPAESGIVSQQYTAGFGSEPTTEQVKYVLNSDDVIQHVEEFLSGKRIVAVEDPESGTVKLEEEKFAKPIINDLGKSEIIRELKMRLSRVFITANFNEQQICTITRIFGRTLLKLLYLNKKKYELDEANIGIIFHGVVDAVFATLSKSQNKTFLNFLKDTNKIVKMRQFGNKPMPKDVQMFKA